MQTSGERQSMHKLQSREKAQLRQSQSQSLMKGNDSHYILLHARIRVYKKLKGSTASKTHLTQFNINTNLRRVRVVIIHHLAQRRIISLNFFLSSKLMAKICAKQQLIIFYSIFHTFIHFLKF